MEEQLFDFLNKEKELLEKLVFLSNKQKEALINYEIQKVESISNDLHLVTVKLKEMEERRIRYFMSKYSLKRSEALELTISKLEDNLEQEKLLAVKRFRISMKNLSNELETLNNTNKILINRARKSVSKIVNSLDIQDGRKVCNVVV